MPRPDTLPDMTLLAKAEAGDIDGSESQDIPGELNAEGGQKKIHHFKANKIYVKGAARGPFQPATPEEIADYKAKHGHG